MVGVVSSGACNAFSLVSLDAEKPCSHSGNRRFLVTGAPGIPPVFLVFLNKTVEQLHLYVDFGLDCISCFRFEACLFNLLFAPSV